MADDDGLKLGSKYEHENFSVFKEADEILRQIALIMILTENNSLV